MRHYGSYLGKQKKRSIQQTSLFAPGEHEGSAFVETVQQISHYFLIAFFLFSNTGIFYG